MYWAWKELKRHEWAWQEIIEMKKGNPMTINKTKPKGLENSSYYHYPLTNHVFLAPIEGRPCLARKNYSFWILGNFPFKMTWQEKMTRKWKEMKGKDMKAAENTGIRQLSKWIERKGKATAIRKDYHPQAVRFYLLPLDHYSLLSGGKWNTRSEAVIFTYNIDANTLVQKILTRHGKDMKEKEVNGHATKRIEMIGQAMTTKKSPNCQRVGKLYWL